MALDYQSIHFPSIFGFLNKTETFILLHYQHSAKILYLAHQQLLNKFVSLFA